MGGRMIQQHDHRAAQMPQQLAEKDADFLLPDVIEVPKTGANFAVVERIRPKIGICAEKLCSSRPIFTRVTSTLQRFCLMNPMQYLLCPGFNKRRTC